MSTDTGTWTLTRAPTSNLSAIYTLYSGPPLVPPANYPYWLDIGDGNNGPLNQQISYTYTFTTWSGSVSQDILPASTIVIEYDDYLQLLVNMLSAGVQSLTPPAWLTTTGKPAVFISMPLVAQPPIPCITINEDLLQQEQVPIGHGMNVDQVLNEYQIQEIVNRRYRVTVITSSTIDREYWKVAIISLFKAILIPVLHKMGQDISSSFQAASSQINPPEAQPGFYFCDIMLEFSGILPVRITTSYPTVNQFDIYANDVLVAQITASLLLNNAGFISLTSDLNWPTTEPTTPGDFWSNGLQVGIAPGAVPNPAAPPVFYGSIDAAGLLALGGANLPTSDPMVALQIWNNGNFACASFG